MSVHPEVCESCTVASLGLGNLVQMVHRYVIFAPQVDVKERTKILGWHGGTLNVPSGKANPPGTIPFHLSFLVRGIEFPQREICDISFFCHVNPYASLQSFYVKSCQVTVTWLLRSVEVDPVSRPIRESLLFDALDLLNLFSYMVCRSAPRIRLHNVERTHIFFENCSVEFGDVPSWLPRPLWPRLHFVFTSISIRNKVPNIGDIHYVLNRITVENQSPAQQIPEHIRPHVSYMGEIVDGWAAGVKTDCPWGQRLEFTEATCVSVVKNESHEILLRKNLIFLLIRVLPVMQGTDGCQAVNLR